MGAYETVSALSDLLNGQTVSARQAADKAEELGIDLPYGTLSGYWAGNHGRPTRQSLAKLAQVVPSLTEAKLQEAAWGRSAPLGPYEPTSESVHLTEPQRRALDDLIKSIVNPGAGHAKTSPRTPKPRTPIKGGQAQKTAGRSPDKVGLKRVAPGKYPRKKKSTVRRDEDGNEDKQLGGQ